MYDFVTADNAKPPHVLVVYREDIGDGTSEQTIAVFYVSEHMPLDVAEWRAAGLAAELSGKFAD